MTGQVPGIASTLLRQGSQGKASRAWIGRGLFAGAMSAMLVISFDITLAALVFKESLREHLALGIGVFIVSSVIIGAVVALGSSFRGAIAAPQEESGIIIALMAGGIVKQMPPGADPYPTVIAAIAVTSVATGIFFLILGLFRAGILVRFIPYPVVGGFLAGTGWLLLQGGLSVMLPDVQVSVDHVGDLLQMASIAKFAPGLLFGVGLAILMRRYDSVTLLPAMLIGAIVVFYLVVFLSGGTTEQVGADGWLLGPFPSGKLWPPLEGFSPLDSVNWNVLSLNIGNIAAVCIMAAITVLLSASGLELATEEEIDLDRELRATGLGNLLAGFVGGAVGYLVLPESSMNHKAGANTRFTGLVMAAICAVVLLVGASVFSYFPRPVLGGLITFMGSAFLIDTLYEGWFRLRRIEYLVIVIILMAIAIWGFLPGVAVGLGVSFILFALSYSRIEVIRNAISGLHLRSNVARSDGEELTLSERGAQLYVLQLQGYVFFGTAYSLLTSAQQRITGNPENPVHYLLLDFRHVNGLDSSAVQSFQRLRKLAKTHGVKLYITEASPQIRNYLVQGEVVTEDDDVCRFFPDLDHGLEACENEIIHDAPPSMLPPPMLFYDLQDVFNGREDMLRFLSYLKREELPAGYDLFKQGDASTDLYLIESGEVTAWLEINGAKIKRLRTMGPGSVVGESGLYMGEKRSATVTATTRATLYRLSESALQRLTAEAPELAAAFHHFVVRLLARRIVSSTGAVKSLFN